jgi:hypothetical protein
MIRIDEEQMGAMAQALGLDRFEDEMVVHLHGFSPRHCELIGEGCMRRAIRLGIDRARAYGVINPGLLRFYIELMFMFGSMFDTDPVLPWAGEVLRKPDLLGEVTRMERLHEAMLRYLDDVGGPRRSFDVQALRGLKQTLGNQLNTVEISGEREVLGTLAWIHPRRCAYLGEPPLQEFLRQGVDVAARYDVATNQGIALVTGTMFVLGHGFAEDPLCPWAQATLRDRSIQGARKRVAHLQKRMLIYLDRGLEILERRQADE